ncbi:MAG: phosphoenolpyruvate synthase [Bacteroidales bacterium]|nr:phosphoenolpyruvate synthase [Bacteroidales bacterium]
MEKKDFAYLTEDEQKQHTYMQHRIHRILMVCCSYDGYILEEDGHIESQINREYSELNMSNPPSLMRVESTLEALEVLRGRNDIDMVLTMYNVGEPDVFDFAKMVKEMYPQMPVVFLTSFSKEIYRQIQERHCDAIDNIFCWHGNSDLIIAIIKLMEDKLNAESDILEGGVQAIMLAEDSFKFYSTYLPELYKIILFQNSEFIKDAYNEQQQINRKRSRPKILLATNFTDAVDTYNKYKNNLLGVITDVGMIVHEGDKPEDEKEDAGVEICKLVKSQTPWMPLIMQSSQVEYAEVAESLGAGFISKGSKTLLSELKNVILKEFGFGEFVVRDLRSNLVLARARDLMEMQTLLSTVPEPELEYHLSQMHLSKWLYARGLFPLAKVIRSINNSNFNSMAEHRAALVTLFHDYRTMLGQGIVAQFDEVTYSDAIGFARIGDGSIGGKARGLSFMNSMLTKYHGYYKYENVRLTIPRSLAISTDYFDRFIEENGLQYVVAQEVDDDTLLSEFVNSTVPADLIAKLKVFVSTCSKPLAIRSSSKLEDSHYQPFAGVYSTYMIPRCEDDDQMLRLLLRAIKSVYASVYFASSRAYIQSSQNVISEEKMAVLIQEVCGTEQDGYYFPTISGVARSQNLYPLGYEKSSEGVCNIVMGLGKAVVEGEKSLRFSPAYPDKALQTSTVKLATSEAQTDIYALNLNPDAFKTSCDDAVNIDRLAISRVGKMRNAKYACSYFDLQNNRLCESEPFGRFFPVITFNRVLKYDAFPLAEIIRDLLTMGEKEMHCPVEIEFAVDMDVKPGERMIFNLLQIRPIIRNNEGVHFNWDEIDTDNAIVYSHNAIGIGIMTGIKRIIYLKFDKFSSLHTQKIADELLVLNKKMTEDEQEYVLIGTGRWGSSDPSLGVPVKWGHISQARVIVESALPDFNIDASQGTHFFQNVTSLGVGYLCLNPYGGDGTLDLSALDAMPALYEGEFMRCVEFEKPLIINVDGQERKGIVKIDKQ